MANQTTKQQTPAWVYLLVIIFLIVGAVYLFGGGGSSIHTVDYVVDGSATAGMITYSDGSANMSQATVNLPWKASYQMRNGALPSMVVQNKGSGQINCKIYVDGQLWRSTSATSQYGVATCNGMVGQ